VADDNIHMDRMGWLDEEPRASAESIAVAGVWDEPSEQEVAELAYSYWEARGREEGSPWEDWFRAERELRKAPEVRREFPGVPERRPAMPASVE
jgi:hypothetical protein